MTRAEGGWRAGLFALFLLALFARGVHLGSGVPGAWEEAIPAQEAIGLWGEPGQSLDLNPHSFRYPSLTIYLNFLAQAGWYFGLSLVGRVDSLNDFRQVLALDPGAAVRLGRWLQVLLGALLVLPAASLGRRLAGRTAGLTAGALAAVLPLGVAESQGVTPDPALALFAGAALVAAVGVVTSGARASYLWCGFWIGLAASSKYPGALLAVALLTAHAMRVRGEGRTPGSVFLSPLLLQSLVAAALAFLATSPYVLLDAGSAAADLGFEGRHMAIGQLGQEQGRAFWFYLVRGFPEGWTIPVSLAALAGGALLLRRRDTLPRALPGAVFAAVFLLVLGSWRMAAARYLLPLVPLGAAWAGSVVAGIPGAVRRPAYGRLATAGGLVLLLALPSLASYRIVKGRTAVDSRVAALEWIEEHVPEGSSILLERYGPEPDRKRYRVLYLPFHSIHPHVYDAAYVASLYRHFDYIVLSSGVSARYLADPREYPQQATFYTSLRQGFREVVKFDRDTSGPVIRILERRPDSTLPGIEALEASYFASQVGNSAFAEFLSALGTVLVRQGEAEEGFRFLTEAVELDPENVKAWGNLGAMRVQAGDEERALLAYRRAQSLAPEDPDVAYNLGTLFARMGEGKQAADQYRLAIRLRPGMEAAYIPLARVLVQEVHYAQARGVLQQFLDRFPRSSDRGAALEALEQLKMMGPGRP